MNEIVVGVDLSQSARAAVTWAAAQARATGQTLQALHAIGGSPALSRTLGMSGVPVPIAASEIDAVYREAVAAVFDSIQPGPALVGESAGATLLVVGTKDHVGIGRLVSGSVSHYCLSHAQCPVVAVPAGPDDTADKDHDHAATDTPAKS